MKNFQKNLQKLEATDTQVLGVSMDSPFSNKAFADQIGVTFPLLSDWGGDTTRKYGVYVDKYKAARRINFLIGKDGKILEEQIDNSAIDPTKNSGRMRAPQAEKLTLRSDGCYDGCAGWSSLVARWAHNPKVGGSNPPPATNGIIKLGEPRFRHPFLSERVVCAFYWMAARLGIATTLSACAFFHSRR